MEIPKYARYDYACEMAAEFLLREKSNSLPVDVHSILKKHKISTVTYSELAKEHNVSIIDICEAYQSKDGYTIFNGNNYCIAYNDNTTPSTGKSFELDYSIVSPKRVYFTLLHEIGHVYLGHFSDFDKTMLFRSNMTKGEYKVLENEASCFARNVHSPAPLVNKLKEQNKNINFLSESFGISPDAAKTRLAFIKADTMNLPEKYVDKLLRFFAKYMYGLTCSNCKHHFMLKGAKFCPICGGKKIKWKGKIEMVYNGIEVDGDSKALECPVCKNEELEHGNYCLICGRELINICVNNNILPPERMDGDYCNTRLPGNARYCFNCGEESTFLKNKILKPYNEKQPLNAPNDDDLPFGMGVNNDDLPF